MRVAIKERVLLVDDEPQVLVALEDLLCDEFEVFKAESAATALTVVENEPDIAVVVTDQRMPNMTGDELLAKLGTSSEATRILVTGFADLSAVIRAVNNGKIFAYVTKPWDTDDLVAKVTKAAERFRLAKELAYERSLLRDLMDNIPDGIYFKDQDLRFLRVNRAFAAMMSSTEPEHLIGKRLLEVRSDLADGEAIEAEERRILSNGSPAQDSLREYSRTGEKRWLSESKAPIRNGHGEVLGVVGISRDVTQHRQLEQQFLQAQKMEVVGQLAGGVAHDFNNVLAVIQGYSELLLGDLQADDTRRGDVVHILAASRRATSLTRQLLAFSRQQITQPQVIELNAIVADIEHMLRRLIGEGIGFATALSPSLGKVKADPSQVEQIVMNLTVNARDAMPEGGDLTIETSNVRLGPEFVGVHGAISPGEYVLLAVTDTGTGIDAETQKRMFEPFFTTKEVGKGTGLGLATVHGIVQQSGGHIEVYSEIGRGTSFKVYFPRVNGDADRLVSRAASTPPVAAVARILVVEDDDDVRRVAVRILRQGGHTVFEAHRASEALTLCSDGSVAIDILLTDVVMPGLSGRKLADELCQLYPKLRVVYMSGYPGAAAARDGSLAAGASYIEKPFSPDSLTKKVDEILTAEKRDA